MERIPAGQGTSAPNTTPLKHVIAEYKHGAQTITCVCGWHGSSAPIEGNGPNRGSEWTAHLAANRPRKD
jgi:hypothetical protein